MPSRIRILEDALADQIAAGEVVERPASVVKELVENAVDAGARSIAIDIVGGGIELIRVRDDGSGMGSEDAALSLKRHATSKIANLDDLLQIRTLGFRGEALPSIASVARVVILTREHGENAGTRVEATGGGEPTSRVDGCAPGTIVEVRDLFFNVPARRKFLKSNATEYGQIASVIFELALAHPELRVIATRDGKAWRAHVPVPSLLERAGEAFPDDALSAIRGERDGVRVEAYLGAPEKGRAGSGALHVFVNQRPVHDRSLFNAIRYAYGSVLPPGRFPVGVVYIDIDAQEVDVNVHPQKAEVRFAKGRLIPDAITRILASGLGTVAWGGVAQRGAQFWAERLGHTSPPAQREATQKETSDPWDLGGSASPQPSLPAIDTPLFSGVVPTSASAERAAVSGIPPTYAPLPEERSFVSTPIDPPPAPGARFGAFRVLGQARRMLIVCEGPDGLVIVDQHAADERVRFDKFRREYAAKSVRVQALLLPERVEVSAEDAALVEDAHEAIARLGLECRALGPTTVVVRGVPVLLSRASPTRLLRDVLTEMHRNGERAFGDAIDMALATMACHGSIRAGDELSPQECAALLRNLDAVSDFAAHCPHGRPIVFSMPFDEIERRIGR